MENNEQLRLKTSPMSAALTRDESHLIFGVEKMPAGAAAVLGLVTYISWSHNVFVGLGAAGVIMVVLLGIVKIGNKRNPFFWRMLSRHYALKAAMPATPTIWRRQNAQRADLNAEEFFCNQIHSKAPKYHL